MKLQEVCGITAAVGVIVWALVIGGFLVLGLTSIIKHHLR